jgi:hypothetical protein
MDDNDQEDKPTMEPATAAQVMRVLEDTCGSLVMLTQAA